MDPAKSAQTRARRAVSWRPLLRSLHRDCGYLAVGFTLIYALSGLAVNHIADWDPNFRSFRSVRQLGGPIAGDDHAIAAAVLQRLDRRGPVRELYRAAPDQLEVRLDRAALHVNPLTGRVVEEGQKPRFLLRIANWLHLNRGKKAWTFVADAYAAALLFLAVSGLFMFPAKRTFLGRGGLLILLGIAVPVLYVALSGGP